MSSWDFPEFSGAAVGGSIFILLVDDDAAFADAAARSLETCGMRTVVALGSNASIETFDSDTVDVLVTDIKLPAVESRGSALAQLIKEKRDRVPVILMSTYPEPRTGDHAMPGSLLCDPRQLAELCHEIRLRLAQ